VSRQLPLQLSAVALAVAAMGCADRGASGGAAPRFQLHCDSVDTSEQSKLFCVRADSRNGDIDIVDLDKLPITSGASRAAEERDGTYQTVCDSTVTPTQSDFHCLRLHTGSGEIVVLRLGELPRWPR
jgi:hypothetical protein